MAPSQEDTTRRLRDSSGGDQPALGELMPLVYDELRRLAGSYLRRERRDHTLQPTALVNEAYLRLIDQSNVRWQNRAHFFGIAARLMREILVEYARSHNAAKRGGGAARLTLSKAVAFFEEEDVDLLVLDDALDELEAIDEEKARMVELRFFSGLSIEQTAEVMEISTATVTRQWRLAKAWLFRRIKKGVAATAEEIDSET
jgi:RNA polymerase sigma-70 factor (ECF subfamily)